MSQREWLVTDGLGGYASGTISDALTRRYHGLLVAALEPPVGRRLLLAKIDTSVAYLEQTHALSSNVWHDGTIAPRGETTIASFRLDGRIPTWAYDVADARIERRIWMRRGQTATFVRYTLAAASASATLALKLYVNDRDYHALTRAFPLSTVAGADGRAAVVRMPGGTAWHCAIDRGSLAAACEWYYGFLYERERERGLDAIEDHLHALTVEATLQPGESLTLVASLAPQDLIDGEAELEVARAADERVLQTWQRGARAASRAPDWIRQLVLSADDFIVDRTTGGDDGKTVIAGYHWFSDWGRDTMIALPGLTLVTGKPEIARSLLTTFARSIDGGMLPNRFPDGGEAPEYNTVDAALWYVEAVRAYYEATGDAELLASIFPALDGIVHAYASGARYGIGVDERDGLLRAGVPGVQLTWMDAKVGDWVVTPRIGKPVEINALWYNALCAMDAFAQTLGADAAPYRALAQRTRTSFARFWNAAESYLFDVLDGPDGNDPSIRPNAIFAAALPFRMLSQERERAIVERAARLLYTRGGLRTLAPSDPAYVGHYAGNQTERDGAYHRGTAWPWLIGAFVRAWMHAFGDARGAKRFVDAYADRLWIYGMGTLAELAEGDPPHDARGCIAQAWSVAEVLRAWHLIEEGR